LVVEENVNVLYEKDKQIGLGKEDKKLHGLLTQSLGKNISKDSRSSN